LFAALTICILPGAAAAKKSKPDRIGLATYNLYLGSDLGPATAAATASRTDKFADEVGFVLKDVLANDFQTRAKTIAKDLIKRKADLVGLQEAAFWKLQSPTDGSGLSPTAQRALNPVADYVQILLEELNRKAKTGKQCKKQDIPKSKCYRGYTLVIDQKEADLEFLGDFDNDPGPDGVTFDVSNSAAFGSAAPAFWLQGNDDPGLSLGEPPAAQCSDGKDNDGANGADWGTDPTCTSNTDNVEGTPAQCMDGVDNDGDTFTDAAGGDVECDPPPGAPAPTAAFDNNEATDNYQAKPSAFPQDMNFDQHLLGSSTPSVPDQGPTDTSGNRRDPAGTFDCNPALPGPQDTDPAEGPSPGEAGAWPLAFTGYDGDTDPVTAGSQVPVCMFHGIDGDLSLTMRDAILKRKGAGVGTSNSRSSNFANKLSLPLFGGAASVNFTRGWTATDAKVRGKKFTFVNTHLESESNGSIREDQAAELIAPGGPAAEPTAVIVGDLNSDPTRAPVNTPDGDGGSNIAINRLLAGGFSFVTQEGLTTGGHGELLSDQSNTLADGWIDHILTNNPGAIKRKGNAQVIDTFANGLWNSDHGGVFVKIKGKKKKNKK